MSITKSGSRGHGQTVLLLRHGETDFKREGRYQGSSPEPQLTSLGIAQTESFIRYLSNSAVDRVLCSPLPRAVQTLEKLGQALVLGQPVEVVPQLAETDIPEWQGLLKAEIAARDPLGLRLWRSRPHQFYSAAGNLVLPNLYAQLQPLVTRIRDLPGVTLIVGHDHLNRALACSLMNLPLEIHASIPQTLSGLALLHRETHKDLFELRASNLHGGTDSAHLSADTGRPRLVFVRHGVTEANRQRVYQGPRYDPPLAEEGMAQVSALVPILVGVDVKAVISSPLQRARMTADFLPGMDSVPRFVDSRLAEYDYGRWTGLSEDEVSHRFPQEVAALYSNVDEQPIEDAESMSSLFRRVRSFLRFAWSLAQDGSTIVVVAHDVVLRAAIAMSLPVDERRFWQFPVDNAAVTELSMSPYGHVQLVRHNILPGNLEDRRDDEYL